MTTHSRQLRRAAAALQHVAEVTQAGLSLEGHEAWGIVIGGAARGFAHGLDRRGGMEEREERQAGIEVDEDRFLSRSRHEDDQETRILDLHREERSCERSLERRRRYQEAADWERLAQADEADRVQVETEVQRRDLKRFNEHKRVAAMEAQRVTEEKELRRLRLTDLEQARHLDDLQKAQRERDRAAFQDRWTARIHFYEESKSRLDTHHELDRVEYQWRVGAGRETEEEADVQWPTSERNPAGLQAYLYDAKRRHTVYFAVGREQWLASEQLREREEPIRDWQDEQRRESDYRDKLEVLKHARLTEFRERREAGEARHQRG